MLRSIDLRRQSGLSHQPLGSGVSIGTTFGWHNRKAQRIKHRGEAGDLEIFSEGLVVGDVDHSVVVDVARPVRRNQIDLDLIVWLEKERH